MRSWVAAVALAALGGAGALAAGSSLAGAWRITAIRGVDAFDAGRTAFEAAADGRVSTTIGCNRMVGKPAVDGDWITFGPMASTRMACLPPLDRLERAYAAALAGVRSWRIEGGRLLLLAADGKAAVTLERTQ